MKKAYWSYSIGTRDKTKFPSDWYEEPNSLGVDMILDTFMPNVLHGKNGETTRG